MGLLSGGQQFFVHRLSKLYIKEHLSTSSDSSDKENLILVDKDEHRYIDKLCWSDHETDKRFLNLFKVAKKEGAAIVEQEFEESEQEEKAFGRAVTKYNPKELIDR